ncbi:hypothetical protein Dda3937_01030 [Dickeya dadantii 3937]|uniref:Uncharacterized protein n=1 Tax=Dickeya dadantii (strain 3937) TaxID=198628 RepID=E0SNC5_DICD3|nr:hypothetical protein Dda3937_01030 [Dickeya dadantii 3937]
MTTINPRHHQQHRLQAGDGVLPNAVGIRHLRFSARRIQKIAGDEIQTLNTLLPHGMSVGSGRQASQIKRLPT